MLQMPQEFYLRGGMQGGTARSFSANAAFAVMEFRSGFPAVFTFPRNSVLTDSDAAG